MRGLGGQSAALVIHFGHLWRMRLTARMIQQRAFVPPACRTTIPRFEPVLRSMFVLIPIATKFEQLFARAFRRQSYATLCKNSMIVSRPSLKHIADLRKERT